MHTRRGKLISRKCVSRINYTPHSPSRFFKFDCLRCFVPFLKHREFGGVVFVTSTASHLLRFTHSPSFSSSTTITSAWRGFVARSGFTEHWLLADWIKSRREGQSAEQLGKRKTEEKWEKKRWLCGLYLLTIKQHKLHHWILPSIIIILFWTKQVHQLVKKTPPKMCSYASKLILLNK